MLKVNIDRDTALAIAALLTIFLIIMTFIGFSNRVSTDVTVNKSSVQQQDQTPDSLFTFDPNTVTYQQLRLLGFEAYEARSIIKYRARGKVFEIPEDFTSCYGVTDSVFERLQPYITIGEQYRVKPFDKYPVDSQRLLRSEQIKQRRKIEKQQWEQKRSKTIPHPYEPFRIDTVTMAYLQTIGFTYRQAEGLIEYRDNGKEGIRCMAELEGCWAVSPQMADSLKRYIIFPEPKPYGGKVEINSADSTALVKLRGIGPKTAQAIIKYRELLGGYVSINQLSELKCVTEENFALFSKQICCDSCVFSKIDINFATASEMEYHPYMTRKSINRIIQLRKSKGGWKSIEEIVNDDIFTEEQVKALAPYLHFGDIPLDFFDE